MAMVARLPVVFTTGKLRLGDINAGHAGFGIDRDVAAPEECNRGPGLRLGPGMADAELPRCTRKPAVGDERNRLAHTLAVQRGGRCEHLAHAGPSTRPLITDDQYLAFFIGPVLYCFETGFLAVETTRRT